MIDDLILAILVGLALAAIRLRDLLGATAVLGAYSLVMAILWCRMNAVDVAFTEAAVGAGISTVLVLAAIARIGRYERLPREAADPRSSAPRMARYGALAACLLMAGALLYGARDMPRVGDAGAPAQVHPGVAAYYMERSWDEVGPPNVVTSVLGDYRGYDTMGETTVIFIAALAVVLLMRQAQAVKKEDDDERDESGRDAS